MSSRDPAEPPADPSPSAALAAALGWLVPGLGQVYVGRPAKGLLYLLVIGSTYFVGLALAGWTCVNPERDPIWFVAQALAGGPTALTAWLTRGLEATQRLPTYDVGLLYVTVAALLNAVAVSDALGTVNEARAAHAEVVAAWRQAEAERLAAEAVLTMPPPATEPPAVADAPGTAPAGEPPLPETEAPSAPSEPAPSTERPEAAP
jgi:TM2 domain-containing membrane protein YozV